MTHESAQLLALAIMMLVLIAFVVYVAWLVRDLIRYILQCKMREVLHLEREAPSHQPIIFNGTCGFCRDQTEGPACPVCGHIPGTKGTK